MRVLIIGVFLVSVLFSLFLKYLTYTKMNTPMPENVKDVFDKEKYDKEQRYKRECLRFSIVDELIGVVFMLVILLLNVHFGLYEWINVYTNNIYLTSLFMMGIPILAAVVLETVMGIYGTFVIEERYGFNKTTPLTYFIDFIKELVIGGLILGGLFSLFLLLYNTIGEWVFFAFFFILLAFQVFMMFISPLMIRIFYKLTPLEDGPLRDKIEAMAVQTGYKFKAIYKVDASKRSAKLNAFAAGFGKTKTIGLFDTMLEKMPEEEILSVLAHEIGHAKKSHVLKSAPISLLVFGIMLAAAYFVVTIPEVSQAFGFSGANVAFGVYVAAILMAPVMTILQIPVNIISRKHEYEADAYARDLTSAEAGVASLKTLYREDLGNLTPHPFVVMMEYSHPPLSDRVSAIQGGNT
ncbi:MAG: M48 family metallopeptidase [Defluviitaleaceae bacterium]|nr:M48 family metallopeptidase [Defluviitaleaceae bacterium]